MTARSDVPEIADWQLERYLLRELPADEMRAVEQALGRDESLRRRLADLEKDTAATLAAHPPRVVGAAVRARLGGDARERQAWRTSLALAAPALAAALVLGIWLGRGEQQPAGPVEPEVTRLKGGAARLLVFRQSDGEVETLRSGSSARPGDVVQLAYQAPPDHYGVILSLDGRGTVTQHLPAEGGVAASLRADGPVTLETAYRLDDAPRFEAFYLVIAPRAFDLGAVSAAAAAAARADEPPAALALPPSFDQAAFVLRKDPR